VASKTSDLRLDYEPIGSSSGVKAVQDRSVDFGASDRPLSRSHLDQAGLAQFPSAVGGVVLMVNIPGVSSETLKLDVPTLASIYLGSIKTWNDSALRALNPEITLPSLPIIPVYRSEGSGTSYVLTTYLAKLSPQFKSTIGVTSTFAPAGGKGGKTSADVSRLVRETAGFTGYFDYAYAIEVGLPTI
jgi:phosphate transport system substrate-binding protein